jgi:hypothetical protein
MSFVQVVMNLLFRDVRLDYIRLMRRFLSLLFRRMSFGEVHCTFSGNSIGEVAK